MEQFQNFGPNDVQNGTLANMFRNAGINDINSYVDNVRQENPDFNDQPIPMTNNTDDHSQVPTVKSNRMGGFVNNAQQMFDKTSNGKTGLGNVKQMYKMVNRKLFI
jgi:hypothetical protein